MRKRSFCLLSIALLPIMVCVGQEREMSAESPPRSGYPALGMYEKYLHLELGIGVDRDFAHRAAGNRLEALTYRKRWAPSYDVRLTHFFSKRWGWYAGIQIRTAAGKGEGQDGFIRTLEKTYDVGVSHYYANEREYNSPLFDFHTGVAYRMEFTRWFVRLRAGTGLTDVNYARAEDAINLREKGEKRWTKIIHYQGNYNINLHRRYVMLSGGVSVGYKLARYLLLTLNATYVQPLGRRTLMEETQDVQSGAVVSRRTFHSTTLGRHLYMDIGVGVPFYFHHGKQSGTFRTDWSKSHRKRVNELMQQKRERFGRKARR